MSKIPATIFTGFLGSGKTTLIMYLIDQLQKSGQQVVYIKNEIGDENIDSQLLKTKQVETKELLNGCICCTLVGPFLSAIDELVATYHPDRIIIEASGVADPSAIALMVSSHQGLYRDGVISIIDVVNFEGYKDISFSAQQQAKFTDLILLNKIELTDDDRKRAVVGYIRELNSWAPILEAPRGTINPELIFGLSSQELTHRLAAQEEHGHHHDHLEEDQLETFTCKVEGSVPAPTLLAFLQGLPKTFFRVKGFAQTTDQGAVLVNKVGVRSELTATDLPFASETHLVFLGFDITREEVLLCVQLNNLFNKDAI